MSRGGDFMEDVRQPCRHLRGVKRGRDKDVRRHAPAEDFEAQFVPRRHQTPVFAIDAQGSRGSSAPPFCSSSTEIRSGERTKAMWPSRGGRLMV